MSGPDTNLPFRTNEHFRRSSDDPNFPVADSTGSFLMGHAVAANVPALGDAFGDVPSATTINYATFGALGVVGVLDDFSIGVVLPIGVTDLSTLQLRYLSGASEVFTGIMLVGVPEPNGFLLLGIGVAGFLLDRTRGSQSGRHIEDVSHVT